MRKYYLIAQLLIFKDR